MRNVNVTVKLPGIALLGAKAKNLDLINFANIWILLVFSQIGTAIQIQS